MSRQTQTILVLAASLFTFSMSSLVEAMTRPIFQPGDAKAMIMLQGLSAGQMDPEPRRLYDMMAVPPTDVAGGGQGKGVKTADGIFTLSCVARAALPEDVLCTIVVKKSARSRVSSRDQIAEMIVTDAEAATLYGQLAGAGATEPFVFDAADGWTRIHATAEKFHFIFSK